MFRRVTGGLTEPMPNERLSYVRGRDVSSVQPTHYDGVVCITVGVEYFFVKSSEEAMLRLVKDASKEGLR